MISLQRNVLAYAGLVSNITIIIVIATSLDSDNFYEIAVDRTVQVCSGIVVILWIVNSLLYRKLFPESEMQSQSWFSRVKQFAQGLKNIKFKKSIIAVAIKMLLATAITLETIFARFINVIFGIGVGILISILPFFTQIEKEKNQEDAEEINLLKRH